MYDKKMTDELLAQLENLDPQDGFALLNKCQDALDKVRERYSNTYTYCAGCFQFVEVKEAEIKEESDGKIVTRCPKCKIPWKIERKEEK